MNVNIIDHLRLTLQCSKYNVYYFVKMRQIQKCLIYLKEIQFLCQHVFLYDTLLCKRR
jgi:hypothetical protein